MRVFDVILSKAKGLIFALLALVFSSFCFAQDVNLACKANFKSMSGGVVVVSYFITLSKDRSRGFFIYDNKHAYKLSLNFTHDAAYFYTFSPHVSANGDFLSFKDVMVGRQSLNIKITHLGDDRVDFADCSMTGDSVMKMVDNITSADVARKKKKDAEDAAVRAERARNTKL